MDKYAAISIMSKDENDLLRESVDYHRLIGVQHFHLWDDGSHTPLTETFQEEIAQGVVRVDNVPDKSNLGRQEKSQKDSLQGYLKDYKWVGLLDSDEFVVLLNSSTDIKDYLREYEQYGAVGLNWLMFGSNNHENKQTSTIDCYTQSMPAHGVNQHIKSFVRPESHSQKRHNVHYVHTKHGTVNVDKGPVTCAFNNPAILDRGMRINHYFCRSKEDWLCKAKRKAPEELNKDVTSKYSEDTFKKYSTTGDADKYNDDIIKLRERILCQQ